MQNDQSNDLTSKISWIEEELNELKKTKPWYKNVSILLSIVALTISIFTTSITYIKNAHDDYLSSRVELRNIISDISNIPFQQADILSKDKMNAEMTAELLTQINTKNLMLARQAASVIERLEDSLFGRKSVLDVEFIAVGKALMFSSVYSEAETYLNLAIERTKDPATAAGAYRSRTNISMINIDIDELRKFMGKASKVFDDKRFENESGILKHFTNTQTWYQWASAEAMLGYCSEAQELLQKANKDFMNIPDSNIKMQIKGQLNHVSNLITKCNNKTQPK